MIINIFISAIIAIFFLRFVSKEEVNKARNASLFRTFVYLCLTIVAFVLFYKSYQVSSITNVIDIKALRGAEDSLYQSRDTVKEVRVYNKFKAMDTYNNKFLDFVNLHGEDSLYKKNGGIFVEIKPSNNPKYPIRNRKSLDPSTRFSYEEELQRDISTIGPLYVMAFLSTNIPSYIPIYPRIEYESEWIHKDGSMGATNIYNTSDAKGLKLYMDEHRKYTDYEDGKALFENSIVVLSTIAAEDKMEKYHDMFLSCRHNFANVINILTAADLSQYTYVISVNTDMHIKTLSVEYNIPIEISGKVDGVTVGSHDFSLNERFLKKNKGKFCMFHVKLPTMANIQLIRSLVLTALLTTLFSLFCKNLYYYIAKWAYVYHRKNRIRFANDKKQRLFQIYNYAVAFIILALLFYITSSIVWGKSFVVDWETIWYWVIGIALVAIVIISITTYYVFKYAITPASKKRGKEKIREREAKEKETKAKEAKAKETSK